MTEAALAERDHGPTVALMTRRASAPPSHSPSLPAQAVDTSTASTSELEDKAEANPRSQSSGNVSNANSENTSADSNAAKPKGTKGSGPAIHQNHPEDACRYPNKRCYNKRAVKNNGELHKFCDMHRDSANRYQRKLEQRLKEKRIQSRRKALQAQQAAQAQAQAQVQVHMQMMQTEQYNMDAMMAGGYSGLDVYTASIATPLVPVRSVSAPPPQPGLFPGHPGIPLSVASAATPTAASRHEDEYEPFQHPVQLESEDLDCLNLFFHEP